MRFQQLSPPARAYVGAVYLGGIAFVGLAWVKSVGSPVTFAFALLTLAATLSHCWAFNLPSRQVYQLSLPFIIAAVILLPPLQVVALLGVLHAVEWLSRRRSLSIVLFNLACYLVAAAVAQELHALLWPNRLVPIDLDQPLSVVAGLVVVAALLFVSRGLIAFALWFGNGIPPGEQQLLAWDSLAVDALLLATGLPLGAFWVTAPLAIPLCLAPLVLIHQALSLRGSRPQAGRDPLTGLYSIEYLGEVCGREVARSAKFGRPLAILAVDVDGLGQINESYGYQTGDAIIQGVGHVLSRSLRAYDLAAHVLGGQFTALLPETDRDEASAVARTIQSAVADRRFDVATSVEALQVSVSVGISVTDRAVQSADELLAAGEAALVDAKRNGRNQLRVSSGAPADAPLASRHRAASLGGLPSAAAADATSRSHQSPSAAATEPEAGQPVTSWPRRLDEWYAAHSPRSYLAVTLVVGAAAGAVVLANASGVEKLNLLTVVWLMTLVALAETRDFQLAESNSYSISVVPIISAGMLLGVPGAIAVAPIASLIRGARRRTRWHRLLFHAIVYVLAAAASAGAFRVFGFGQHLTASNLVTLLPAAGLAGVAFYLHTFVAAASTANELRVGPARIWSEKFRWLWPQYVVLSIMGLLLVLAYREFGILGMGAFVVPPLMMRYVAKQYIDHTVENVRQLRSLNEELGAEIAHRTAVEKENVRLASEVARIAALEELSRLKSEFISIASHELRTPLTSILGFSELLIARTPADLPNRFMISVIHDEAMRLAKLVDNLLDSSRIETGRMAVHLEPTDVGALLRPLIKTLGAPTPKHYLVVDVDPNARWVMADPPRLQEVLSNLIDNAIKYSPDGGRVVVAVRPSPATSEVEISVADEGIGIPADYLERIFDRFQRVDSSETRTIRGTGLGLYISRHIVELHRGVLRVESAVGRGSTFSFTLPSAAPPATVAARGPLARQTDALADESPIVGGRDRPGSAREELPANPGERSRLTQLVEPDAATEVAFEGGRR